MPVIHNTVESLFSTLTPQISGQIKDVTNNLQQFISPQTAALGKAVQRVVGTTVDAIFNATTTSIQSNFTSDAVTNQEQVETNQGASQLPKDKDTAILAGACIYLGISGPAGMMAGNGFERVGDAVFRSKVNFKDAAIGALQIIVGVGAFAKAATLYSELAPDLGTVLGTITAGVGVSGFSGGVAIGFKYGKAIGGRICGGTAENNASAGEAAGETAETLLEARAGGTAV